MNGSFLRFYVEEGQRYRRVLLWKWLLAKANALGIRGGSAFRSIGGFGRHHTLHEDKFFELAGKTGVEVEFVVSDQEAVQLLDLIREKGIRVMYARIPALFGVLNPDAEDPPSGTAAQ